jgi:predicted nucleotidyltransferase
MASPGPAQVLGNAAAAGASQDELLRAFRLRVDEKILADLAAEERTAQTLRQEVLASLGRAVQRAREDGWRGRVWLFGSFAWGQPNERSDIDLLVEGDERTLARRVSELVRREVHALKLAEAPASLKERVLADGLAL